MLTEPISVTIDGVAHSMPRVSTQESKSIYVAADQNHTFTVSHQKTSANRVRSMVRIDERVVAADPLTAANKYESASIYVVFDVPAFGFSIDDVDDIARGFITWLSTANVTKVLGLEH